MAHQQPGNSGGGYSQNSYDDPAFHPQTDYNFDHSYGHDGRLSSSNAGEASVLLPDYKMERGMSENPLQRGPYGGMMESFTEYPSSGTLDPPQLWGGVQRSFGDSFDVHAIDGAPLPSSVQTEIVKQRGGSANQNFGQITPPNSNTPEQVDDGSNGYKEAGPGENAEKFDRSARARKAANQRHAMAKKSAKARQNSQTGASDLSVEEDGGDDDDKREKYRERNRVAAAKCRAKKRQSVGGLEETHRQEQATNSFLKRQVMSLRDELSEMRTAALLHDARDARCRCEGIHQYNHKKAMELTMSHFGPGVSPTMGLSKSPVTAGLDRPGTQDAMRRMSTPSQSYAMTQNFGFPQAIPDAGHAEGDGQFSGMMHSGQDQSDGFPH